MFKAKQYFETNDKRKFKRDEEVPEDVAAKYSTKVIEVESIEGSSKINEETKEVIQEVIDKVQETKEELLIDETSNVDIIEEIIEDGVVDTKEKGILGKMFGGK